MRHSDTIVLLEDPRISGLLRAIVQQMGFHAVESEPAEALAFVQSGRGSLVITNRPRVFLEVADKIRLIYVSSTHDMSLADQFPVCRILRKPFRPSDVAELIGELTRRGPA